MLLASTFLILLFLLNSNLVLNTTYVSVSAQSEKELLLELRNNLTYYPSDSSKLLHWNESLDVCRWAGVKCDGKGKVSALDLSGESISDGINGAGSSLFKLTHMQSLSLAQNTFSPIEFPSGFGQLAELRYLNLSSSGFSGQIPLDLSNLRKLVSLDLSLDFATSLNLPNLQRLILNFTSLRELYLDRVNISANGNEWGSAISSSLPNLTILSMSSSFLTGPFHPSLQKLQSLSDIRLDGNNFSSPFPEFITGFPNLQVLILSSCGLSGLVPAKLFQMKSIQTIRLGGNEDLLGSFPEFPANGSLQVVVLDGTKFSGILPESIGNLRMLSELSIAGCNISGPIPNTIKNLKHLVMLNLDLNRFSGPVPSFAMLKNLTRIDLSGNMLKGLITDSLWQGLDSLVSLKLRGNSLVGEIPFSLFLLPALEELVLSNNTFSGITKASMSSLSQIQTLDLSHNKLEGPVPPFVFELRSLASLDLSSNKFSGSLELAEFEKLTNLSNLDLSYNNLSVRVNDEASFSSLLPHVFVLKLASCKLKRVLNVANHPVLAMLDLSGNELGGEIPNWLWGDYLSFLNLSYNRFTHFQEPYDLRRLGYLNLRSNMLAGQIPSPLPSAVVLDFSNNNFSSLSPDVGDSLVRTMFFSASDNRITGEIPPSLCNASNLDVLDLSNNTFYGEIPSCLLNNTLRVLNLRRNNLEGQIPNTFPDECSLETLDLSRNLLEHKLPNSLTKCSNLEVLDLAKNAINDTFPCWLDTLSELRVLVLRSNTLHGNISCMAGNNTTWQNLQIIDIASNSINGTIPAKLFDKLHALKDGTVQQQQLLHFSMQTVLGLYYQDTVTVTMKGQTYDLEKIQTFFTSIDFSDNHLQGAIPATVGDLKSLYLLNFSHNALSGHIPPFLARAAKLQSLDLSFNALDGEIPSELASHLTFLAVLNLSYNHLVGRIPVGNQFQTFTETSFLGNEGLCGFPINRTCIAEGGAAAAGEEETEEGFLEGGIYVSAALGFVVGLGFIVGPVLLCKRWRVFYNKHLTRITLLLLCRKNQNRLQRYEW